MLFIGKDLITVGAIHESPAVPKRQSVRMFFSLYGRFVNRPYNLFKHPDKPKFEKTPASFLLTKAGSYGINEREELFLSPSPNQPPNPATIWA